MADSRVASSTSSRRAAATSSLNLGVRAEKVDSAATGNINSVDHSTLVPRLGATYDVRGDGRYTFSSTYSQYAGNYNESQFGQNTNVGTPDLLLGVYTGPPGQGRDFAPGFDPNNYFTVVGGLSSPQHLLR
jgi:hypothetical protein